MGLYVSCAICCGAPMGNRKNNQQRTIHCGENGRRQTLLMQFFRTPDHIVHFLLNAHPERDALGKVHQTWAPSFLQRSPQMGGRLPHGCSPFQKEGSSPRRFSQITHRDIRHESCSFLSHSQGTIREISRIMAVLFRTWFFHWVQATTGEMTYSEFHRCAAVAWLSHLNPTTYWAPVPHTFTKRRTQTRNTRHGFSSIKCRVSLTLLDTRIEFLKTSHGPAGPAMNINDAGDSGFLNPYH